MADRFDLPTGSEQHAHSRQRIAELEAANKGLREALAEAEARATEAERELAQERDPFWDYQGEEQTDEERALSLLLRDEGTLFVFEEQTSDGKPAASIWVNCGDLFAWACADAEPLPKDQIGALFKAVTADPKRGVSKWCCKRRNRRPQPAVERQWRAEGAWDAEMETLPANTQDAETKAVFAALAVRRAAGLDAMPNDGQEKA